MANPHHESPHDTINAPIDDGLHPVPYENLPEAVQTPLEADNFTKSLQENIPYAALEQDQRQKRPTICGLRRKVFWTVIILVILAVVGAAVGGGVGGSLSSRNHKATTTPSLPTSTGTLAKATSIAPNSKLAALNFTLSGVTYNQVFWQDTNSTIQQSSWNDSSKSWMVTAVTVPTNMIDADDNSVPWENINVKNGTALSIANEVREDFFQTSLIWLDDKTGLQMAYQRKDGPWKLADGWASSRFPIASYSHIASSWIEDCDSCMRKEVAVFQNLDNDLLMINRSTNDAGEAFKISGDRPSQASSFACAPRWNKGVLGLTYFTDVNEAIQVVAFTPPLGTADNTSYWDVDTDAIGNSVFPDSADIAALSYGYTDDGSTVYTQALLTQPQSDSGGVWTVRRKENFWQSGSALDGMSDVLSYSAIAANQNRRVYAMIENEAGNLELFEWELDDRGDATAVGTVSTTIMGN